MSAPSLFAALAACIVVGLAVGVVARAAGIRSEVSGAASSFVGLAGMAFFLFRFAGVL